MHNKSIKPFEPGLVWLTIRSTLQQVFFSGTSSAAAAAMLPHGSGQDLQYCPVTFFLGQLLKLLVCPNEKFGTQIQKYVKELVGHEISPALYPILFDQIKIIVEKFFDSSGQVSYDLSRTECRGYQERCSVHLISFTLVNECYFLAFNSLLLKAK